MAETTKTFLELIKDYKIIIPLIQRDYAQGREKEKNKAEKFLEAIKNGCNSKLNLDFVYGKRDKENKIFIPLDGQQRLTTLFLIHWYLSLENDYKLELSNFSYEVRSSSKDFLEELTKNKNWKIFSRKNIKTQVENSNWFFLSWKKDLTVVSLLNMLDLIEKFFEKEDINNLNNITFDILYLNKFKLTDELYVKMNARGKPLTLFENFKAEFESYIEKTGDSKEVIAKNKASFDNEWLNIFWNLAKKKVEEKQINIDEAPKLADEMFYNFFYNSTFNLFLAKQDKILKINNEEYSTINNFIEENDIFSFYKQTFDDTNTIGIIKVLNNLKVDEIFETFVNNIDKITQWDRAKFYALYLGYICDLDENEFGRWKRVSFNLINNQLIQSPEDLIKTIQSLNDLIENSNKDIYGYIKDNYEVIHYFSTIQRKEESLKVNLISNDENWEKELIDSAKKSLIIESTKTNCMENKNYIHNPSFEITEDVVIPYLNKTLFKKGYIYNPLKENNIKFKTHQIFINADDIHQLMLAVKYSKQADIFVVKGDMQNIFDYGIEAYAFREKIEGKAFNINCLPTVFTQKDYTFVVNEYLLNDESENKEKSND